MKKIVLFAMFAFVILVAACSSPQPTPQATKAPAWTATLMPTSTVTPASTPTLPSMSCDGAVTYYIVKWKRGSDILFDVVDQWDLKDQEVVTSCSYRRGATVLLERAAAREKEMRPEEKVLIVWHYPGWIEEQEIK